MYRPSDDGILIFGRAKNKACASRRMSVHGNRVNDRCIEREGERAHRARERVILNESIRGSRSEVKQAMKKRKKIGLTAAFNITVSV